MRGKTVVITGGTSGIGQVAAEKLAAMGARIVLVARDKARGEQTLARLQQAGPGAHPSERKPRSLGTPVEHTVHYADLSRLSEMKRVAQEIAAAEPRIDVLMNNAGALFANRRLTADGLEMTFALNHMSYFVVTLALRERLVASRARVINTASDAHKGEKLDLSDLQSAHGYRGLKVYGRSKLMNILFTSELARRWAGTGVTANCLHPGFVATRFGDESGGMLSGAVRAAKMFAITPEQGAETLVYLASAEEVTEASGLYFYKCRPATPTAEARDADAARRLWEESEEIARIAKTAKD